MGGALLMVEAPVEEGFACEGRRLGGASEQFQRH